MKKETILCSRCMHKYDGVPSVKLTEAGPRVKVTCSECGKRAYGARCLIEVTKKQKRPKKT